MNLKGRDFLKLLDYTTEEILGLIDLAADLKAKKKAGISHRLCEGKNVALIFEKTSTRTRCSFEVAAYDLGMGRPTLTPRARKSVKRRVLRTPQGYFPRFTTASNTVALGRRLSRSLQNTPPYPFGMV